MKTIAKAVTNKLAKDGYGNMYSGKQLITGECYLVENGRLKHMLLPQEIIEEGCSAYCLSIESQEKFEDDRKNYLTRFRDRGTINM